MPIAKPYRMDQSSLRNRITRRGLTHNVVAKEVGVCRRLITAILNEDPFVKRATLIALANVLQVAPWELCDKVATGVGSQGELILADFTEAMFQDDLIPGVGGAGDLRDVFKRIYRGLVASAPEITECTADQASCHSLEHIEDYWSASLQAGDLVSLNGVLSPLSPILIGNPDGLLEFHKRFRGLAEKYKIDSPLSNANFSISAGQIVWNVGQIGAWHVLGLYHSIVRNSIVVFVDEQYYAAQLRGAFVGRCRDAAEAEVTGRVALVSGFGGMISGPLVEKNSKLTKTPHALVVSQRLQGTSAVVRSSARYLDGDLFCVVADGGVDRLRTLPTNLSNPERVDESLRELNSIVGQEFPTAKSVIEYDNLREARA